MFRRDLTASSGIAPRAVRLQGGSFQYPGAYTGSKGHAREARISVTFGAANAPTLVYHNLGFVPSGYTVLGIGAPASVYNDFPIPSTSRVIVLKCDTANTVADILVR